MVSILTQKDASTLGWSEIKPTKNLKILIVYKLWLINTNNFCATTKKNFDLRKHKINLQFTTHKKLTWGKAVFYCS
jgi:hypothetical protein